MSQNGELTRRYSRECHRFAAGKEGRPQRLGAAAKRPALACSHWLTVDEQARWPQWVPVGRMGLPENQARVILVLASAVSAFATGHAAPTDGGTGAAGGWFRSARRTDREWTNRPAEA